MYTPYVLAGKKRSSTDIRPEFGTKQHLCTDWIPLP